MKLKKMVDMSQTDFSGILKIWERKISEKDMIYFSYILHTEKSWQENTRNEGHIDSHKD